MDFFPLTVNYQERYYAAGKIPGGYFKRERAPTERETLISRLIDRPIRPLVRRRLSRTKCWWWRRSCPTTWRTIPMSWRWSPSAPR